MRSPTIWFELYGESHQNKLNKAIHWVCIPVILVSLLGLLQSIPHPFGDLPLSWASVVAFGCVLFYLRLSWTIGLGMALVAGSGLALNQAMAEAALPVLWISVALFFVAWVFQFIGHKVEGAKPSFFEDLQFLLIGPAWLLQFIYKKLGVPVETWRASSTEA